jgi:hypothetical protein
MARTYAGRADEPGADFSRVRSWRAPSLSASADVMPGGLHKCCRSDFKPKGGPIMEARDSGARNLQPRTANMGEEFSFNQQSTINNQQFF